MIVMSAVTRQKKKAQIKRDATRREVLDRLRGTTPDLDEIREHCRQWVLLGWGERERLGAPPVTLATEDPWTVSKRDGTKRTVSPGWAHLRKYLPDINQKTIWTLKDRTMHEALVAFERAARSAVRENGRAFVSRYHFDRELTYTAAGLPLPKPRKPTR